MLRSFEVPVTHQNQAVLFLPYQTMDDIVFLCDPTQEDISCSDTMSRTEHDAVPSTLDEWAHTGTSSFYFHSPAFHDEMMYFFCQQYGRLFFFYHYIAFTV